MPDEDERATLRPSRRQFVGAALGAAGALVAGGAGGVAIGRATDTPATSAAGKQVPFYGVHQAGIATPAQDRLAFAAFDLTTTDRTAVEVLLGTWAAAAAQMTAGQLIGPINTAPQAPPVDTGEALGLGPAALTITVGFGPSMFDDRFGLASKRPAALADIPPLPGDQLRRDISGGDIGVQACSNDPQVAFHVIRNFARLARGTAVMRWSQLGFGRTSSTSTSQDTPRNLMGFKDGTNDIKAEDTADFDDYVWVGSETDQPWMRGGSYLVTRRIRMFIESWDTDYLADQERVFGRFKTSGAPLTGKHEFDPVDLDAKNPDGTPVISLNAHIRLASPSSHGGQKILRRGYSFTDGIDQTTGLLDAGLFFIAYQKDPRKQFVPIQRLLGSRDNLNEYIQHTSSALFAVPPGLSGAGDWWGKDLFA
ncbi:MAG TPA: iron uptake transporter deferrochelatase/peroxidase subunit [Mycobacteriales bacterium]|nr:iron uptake transporter deferrochelatase/peroxidase subunit [Mycobacteriales bacterium]